MTPDDKLHDYLDRHMRQMVLIRSWQIDLVFDYCRKNNTPMPYAFEEKE